MQNNTMLINTSILYRSSTKFFDRHTSKYGFGYGQLIFLIMIYENEGISMQSLATKGFFDKGTITKSIQKLEELGYVHVVTSEQDKRVKLLYTTEKVEEMIPDLYMLRKTWYDSCMKNLQPNEITQFENLLEKITQNAIEEIEIDDDEMHIFGFQKTTLLDYPGKLACTIFTGGCNMRCPFCHNSHLVFMPENIERINEEEIYEYLEKRKGILEAVCISGGEPLLQEGILSFVKKIKELGYPIKLDTNGTSFEKLKYLIEENYIDYVAVDIKNCKDAYAKTSGIDNLQLDDINKTVDYLLAHDIPYEFRTTIVQEFHTVKEIEEIGKWVKGAKSYYLQNFIDHGSCIQKGLHSVSLETLQSFKEIMEKYVEHVEIRGV